MGTAMMDGPEDADEPTVGYIILYRVVDGKLHCMSRTEVDGGV